MGAGRCSGIGVLLLTLLLDDGDDDGDGDGSDGGGGGGDAMWFMLVWLVIEDVEAFWELSGVLDWDMDEEARRRFLLESESRLFLLWLISCWSYSCNAVSSSSFWDSS